jgi:hypothetical protein
MIAYGDKPLAEPAGREYGQPYTREEVVREFEYVLDM